MVEKEIIKPITLSIPKIIWEKFRSIVTRDKTLNDAVVELIEREVRAKKT